MFVQKNRETQYKLVPSVRGQRRDADEVFFTPLLDQIDVEIKAPMKLCAPDKLTEDEAEKLIEKCWKKSRGQRGKRASILVIGGIYIPKEIMKKLKIAADNFFQRKKNENVAFIEIFSITLLLDKPIITEDSFGISSETSLSNQITTHSAKNPFYKGIVDFIEVTKSPSGFKKSENHSELRIGKSKKK